LKRKRAAKTSDLEAISGYSRVPGYLRETGYENRDG
jgi:hypothetical protein